MGDEKIETKPASHTHLAFTSVTNIKNYVPVTLDFSTTNFTMWSRYFMLLVTRLRLKGYIDGTLKKKDDSDLDWVEFDAQIQSWILNSVSHDMARLLITSCDSSAKMWSTISDLFRDQKKARAMDLNNQFTHTKKGNRTITEYCQFLKDIFDNLADLEAPKKEEELVLQILKGLPKEYENLTEFIPMQNPFPTFLQARSLLLLREQRLLSGDESDGDLKALSVQGTSTSHDGSSSSNPPGNNRNNNQNRGKNNRRNNQNRRQNTQNRSNSNNSQPNDMSLQQLTQALQCLLKLPSTGPTAAIASAVRQPMTDAPQPRATAPPSVDANALAAAILRQVQGPSPSQSDTWYMDSGASNHLVSNSGSSYAPDYQM